MTKRLVLVLALLAFAFSASAVADTIDFNFAGTGGSYTFSGSSVFSGTESPVTVHQVLPTPGAPVALPGSTLTWTSGAYAGTLGGIAVFAGGGSLSITGVPACAGGTCFLGTFTGAQFDFSNNLFISTFVAGNVDPAIWALVGLPTSPTGATGSLSANLASTSSRGGVIASGDLTLTRVPEPASLAILGGMFLLGGATLRRKFAL